MPITLALGWTLALAAPSTNPSCSPPAAMRVQSVPGHPFSAVPSADGCWLFVTLDVHRRHSAIAVLRDKAGTYSLARVVHLHGGAYGAALSPDGRALLVAGGDSTLVLDVAALEARAANPVLGRLRDGRGAGAVYLRTSRDGRFVFVSAERRHRIDVFDLTKARAKEPLINPCAGGMMPRKPAGRATWRRAGWLPDQAARCGLRAFWTSPMHSKSTGWARSVCPQCRVAAAWQATSLAAPLRLALRTDRTYAGVNQRFPNHFDGSGLVGHVPVGIAPVGLAVSPDGQWLYSTSERAAARTRRVKSCMAHGRSRRHAPGFVARIDVALAETHPAHALSGIVRAGCNPVRVAVSPSGKWLWVTARGDGKLLQIPAAAFVAHASHAKVSGYKLGASPVGVAARPDGKQVWVALSNRFAGASYDPQAHQLVGLAGIDGRGEPTRQLRAPASGFPRELTFLPDGRTLVVTLFAAKRIEFVPTPK